MIIMTNFNNKTDVSIINLSDLSKVDHDWQLKGKLYKSAFSPNGKYWVAIFEWNRLVIFDSSDDDRRG